MSSSPAANLTYPKAGKRTAFGQSQSMLAGPNHYEGLLCLPEAKTSQISPAPSNLPNIAHSDRKWPRRHPFRAERASWEGSLTTGSSHPLTHYPRPTPGTYLQKIVDRLGHWQRRIDLGNYHKGRPYYRQC